MESGPPFDWLKTPTCKHENIVRVDDPRDYEPYQCSECKALFRKWFVEEVEGKLQLLAFDTKKRKAVSRRRGGPW